MEDKRERHMEDKRERHMEDKREGLDDLKDKRKGNVEY